MSRHIQVTFDAHDPAALSSFWRDVLVRGLSCDDVPVRDCLTV